MQQCLKQYTGKGWGLVPATAAALAQARRQANSKIEQGKKPSTVSLSASAIYERRRQEASACKDAGADRTGVLEIIR